jgi:hypothetical protein
MMSGNKYRVLADKCFKAAASTADLESKLAQLVLAQRWLRLATEIDAATRNKRSHDLDQVRRRSPSAA